MNDASTLRRARGGDKEALELIVKENEGLVWSVARRFANRGYDVWDLFQTGSIGLIKAVRRFDESYGVKFSTYAVPLIMGEIRRFLRDDGMVKVSRRYKEISAKAASARGELALSLNREPTIGEIAEQIGVNPDEVAEAAMSCAPCESIYKTVAEGGRGEIYLADTLASDDGDAVLDRVALLSAFESLNEREQTIIKMRYFMDRTQTQVAQKLGISQVQVSRTEKKILRRMKESLKDCI